MTPGKLISQLAQFGVTEYAGVPDSILGDFSAWAQNALAPGKFTVAANEGLAVSYASARQMATGRPVAVFMQNSGLGNCVNPLMSLTHEMVYRIPLFLIIGWRGEPGKKDEPQHRSQGAATLPLLADMGVYAKVLAGDDSADEATVNDLARHMIEHGTPVALVISKGSLACDGERPKLLNDFNRHEMSREEAIGIIARHFGTGASFVATTGMISRELYAYRDANGQGHKTDFLTVGSMGHASTLALGMALEYPWRQFVCLDGDGAFLMHMGGFPLIASRFPRNLACILLNNSAHDSVGGIATIANRLDIIGIVKACGFAGKCAAIDSAAGLEKALEAHGGVDSPMFLNVQVRPGHRGDLPRPTATPEEAKLAFIEALKRN